MQRKQFDQLALAIARAEHPQYKWRLADDRLEAHAAADDAEVQSASLSLTGMHAKAPHNGDVRSWITENLGRLAQILTEGEIGDWATEAANIRPLLKPTSWLMHATRAISDKPSGAPACVFPWYGPLCISCVIDRPTTMLHITQEHLDTWQVSAEEVYERALANPRQGQPLMMQVHKLAGFTVAHVEPTSYTATYAILPAFRQSLAQHLGPRYRICFFAENLLIAYAPNAAPYNLAHEEELAQDLIEMTRAGGDPSKPLPYTGHLEVDIEAGTVAWQPHPPTTELDQDDERMIQNIIRRQHLTARGSTAPRTRKNYTQ